MDKNINILERRLNIKISNSGEQFSIKGAQAKLATLVLVKLHQLAEHKILTNQEVELCISQQLASSKKTSMLVNTPRKTIEVSSPNQQNYVMAIEQKSCVFAIGPAGTGKTFLAVAKAIQALEKMVVRRIILVRPVIEAGEKLGFLPGDLSEKVDPYLRPIYDALHYMLGSGKTNKFIEQNIIEIAPLAFMRGRTLNDAFVILDEAQNTTNAQMKMFLTRLGFGAKMVITGDVSQIDLSPSIPSGLNTAVTQLKKIKDITFCYLNDIDVMRHPLVSQIIKAYQKN